MPKRKRSETEKPDRDALEKSISLKIEERKTQAKRKETIQVSEDTDPLASICFTTICNFREFKEKWQSVQDHRVISPTPFNIESSRSHLIMIFKTRAKPIVKLVEGKSEPENNPVSIPPNLFVVADLAGEEKFESATLMQEVYDQMKKDKDERALKEPSSYTKLLDQILEVNKKDLVDANRVSKTKTRLLAESKQITDSLQKLKRLMTFYKLNTPVTWTSVPSDVLSQLMFKILTPRPGKSQTLVSFLIAINRNPVQLKQNAAALKLGEDMTGVTLGYELLENYEFFTSLGVDVETIGPFLLNTFS